MLVQRRAVLLNVHEWSQVCVCLCVCVCGSVCVLAGTEIFQSYCPLSWDYTERQEHCQSVYGFTCTCQRCKVRQYSLPHSCNLLGLHLSWLKQHFLPYVPCLLCLLSSEWSVVGCTYPVWVSVCKHSRSAQNGLWEPDYLCSLTQCTTSCYAGPVSSFEEAAKKCPDLCVCVCVCVRA